MDPTTVASYAPWIAGLLLVAAILTSDRESAEKRQAPPLLSYVVLAILVAGAIFGAMVYTPGTSLMPIAKAFGLGALSAALLDFLQRFWSGEGPSRAVPIAAATTLVGASQFWLESGAAALVLGLACAAWLLRVNRPEEPSVAADCAVGCAVLLAANSLGQMGTNPIPGAGTLFGVVGTVAALGAGLVQKSLGPNARIASGSLYLAIAAGLGYVVAERVLTGRGTALPYLGGVAVALISGIVMSASGSIRPALSAVLWLLAGTAAFSFEQGYGTAVLLAAGWAALIGVGARVGLATLAPAIALLVYRVFYETYGKTPVSFDVAQHYTMVGVLLGMALPVVFQEWLRASGARPAATQSLAGILWVVALLSLPVLSAILLGARGSIGFLLGLGFGPVIASLRGERSTHSLALSVALATLMTGAWSWLEPLLDLTRDEKVRMLGYVGGGLAVVGLLIAALSYGIQAGSKEAQA